MTDFYGLKQRRRKRKPSEKVQVSVRADGYEASTPDGRRNRTDKTRPRRRKSTPPDSAPCRTQGCCCVRWKIVTSHLRTRDEIFAYNYFIKAKLDAICRRALLDVELSCLSALVQKQIMKQSRNSWLYVERFVRRTISLGVPRHRQWYVEAV